MTINHPHDNLPYMITIKVWKTENMWAAQDEELSFNNLGKTPEEAIKGVLKQLRAVDALDSEEEQK